MKANKISAAVRLLARTTALDYTLGNYSEAIGGGNPYHRCRYCHVSDPELHRDGGRHRQGCPIPGWGKELIHYHELRMAALKPSPVDRARADDAVISTLRGCGVEHLLVDRKR